MCYGQLVHNPIHDPLQRLGFDGPTGFADGRQRAPSPVIQMRLVQRAPQETGRYADEIHVAGLPLASASLTVSQAQPLLPISRKGLGACPPIPLDHYHTDDFPPQAVAHQRRAGLLVPTGLPKHHHPPRMIDVRNAPLLAKVSIPPLPHAHGLLRAPRELPGHRLQGLLPPVIHHVPGQLQIADIRPLLALHMVEHCGAGTRALTGERPREPTRPGILDPGETQRRVVLALPRGTRRTLLEALPCHGLVRPRGHT